MQRQGLSPEPLECLSTVPPCRTVCENHLERTAETLLDAYRNVWGPLPSARQRSETPLQELGAEIPTLRSSSARGPAPASGGSCPPSKDRHNPAQYRSFRRRSRKSTTPRSPCSSPAPEKLPHSTGTLPTARSPDSKPAGSNARTLSANPCARRK